MLAVQRPLSALIVLGIAVQFLLAGAGAFGATSYDAHRTLGVVLLVLAGVALVTAVSDRRYLRTRAALVLLLALQFLLGHLGARHPWLGAVHGLVALGVAGAAVAGARK